MPKSSKSTGSKAVLVLAMISALGVGGLAAYVELTPSAAHVPQDERKPSLTRTTNEPTSRAVPLGPKVDITSEHAQLLVPEVSGEDVKLQRPAGDIPMGMKPMVFIAGETFKSLKLDGARALGVQISDRTARLDVNQTFAEFGFGSMQEGQVVKALQMALGQFPEIDTFELYSDGKKLDTLGQLDLESPIEVIRPQESDDAPPEEG